MGERDDDDDDGEVVAMLLYLLHCRCRCVANRCNAMDGVAGQMGESGGERTKVTIRKRTTRWPCCHVLHVVVIASRRGQWKWMERGNE